MAFQRKDVLEPLLLPEGEVFRPRKLEVDQLKPRDFLGEAKVIQIFKLYCSFNGCLSAEFEYWININVQNQILQTIYDKKGNAPSKGVSMFCPSALCTFVFSNYLKIQVIIYYLPLYFVFFFVKKVFLFGR